MMIEKYLKSLRIPYTRNYLQEEYATCPHSGTLWGMGYLLSKYGIEYAALRLKDKERIRSIDGPFLAQLSEEIVLVTRQKGENIFYHNGKTSVRCSHSDFLDKFSGVVLFATNIDNASEPDYAQHKKQQVFSVFSKVTLPLTVCALLVYCAYNASIKADALFFSVLVPGILGLVVSSLLLQKTVSADYSLADRVCSLFGQTQCNDLLHSDAANIAGSISLSECGAAYFSGNIILLCAFGDTARLAFPLISIISLPFTVLSIWYQAARARKWCALCLLVQATLWIQFLSLLASGSFSDIAIDLHLAYGIALCAIVYLIILLCLHGWKDLHLKNREREQILSQLKEIKYTPDIFQLLLQKQEHLTISEETSCLDFNHTEAHPFQIVILSNPFCDPCAKMHAQLKSLYEKGYPIKYIFTSFTPNLEEANRYLIAYYLKYGPEMSWQLLSDWYSGGRDKGPRIFEGSISHAEAHAEAVEAEIVRHREWVHAHGLSATPMVFVNGNLLSGNLRINDIVELSNINAL